jgi:hypothetical protein
MSEQHGRGKDSGHCEVKSETRTPFTNEEATPIMINNAIIKVPVLLTERTIQIVVEGDIELDPPAVEIKRVLKDVFLTQCQLVPVAFEDDTDKDKVAPDVRRVTRAKLFVEGFIRKNIEFVTDDCHGEVKTRTANVHFSGFTEIKIKDFDTKPLFGFSSQSRAEFINPKNGELPRLDKNFFQNSVFYNEQPYCELVSADFFELDFSPHPVKFGGKFDRLREKIVMDLTLKVLQNQQVRISHRDHEPPGPCQETTNQPLELNLEKRPWE